MSVYDVSSSDATLIKVQQSDAYKRLVHIVAGGDPATFKGGDAKPVEATVTDAIRERRTAPFRDAAVAADMERLCGSLLATRQNALLAHVKKIISGDTKLHSDMLGVEPYNRELTTARLMIQSRLRQEVASRLYSQAMAGAVRNEPEAPMDPFQKANLEAMNAARKQSMPTIPG